MENTFQISKIQPSTTGLTTSNNDSSMPDNVVKASNQVASWNVVNTTATINTPSTNVQTLPRNVICNAILTKRVSDITNSCFNYKTSTYIDLPKCTDRSMCNNENVNEFNKIQTPVNGVTSFNIQDSINKVSETPQDINKVQTNVNFSTSNDESCRISSKGIVMPAVVIPEDPRGSVSLIRPSYFIPGQAKPKTLDDEGIKMMKSGNKILLPKSEGSQGFVIPGSQILMQTTNKMGNDENLAPKPDYSYASMICQAIFSSSGKKSTLAEIYEWICSTYPFFKRNQQGWKNSIRHNLSLNAAFVRASRGEGVTGKGGYWMVDPKYERYFVNGHFKPPSSETKSSYKRSKLLDENEMIITTSKATAVANKKNGTIQSHKQSHNQVAREKLRQIKDNIEAAVQITLQLKDEKNVSSLKKKAKVEIVKNVEKVTETINCEDIPTGPEKDREKIMIAEGCDEVYRRYYDGNDPNWRSDAEFFASFSPFL
ncbi:uncharacterized protein OCT59_019480 [Rhizophagus irregularis]|uniref:Fork-head domain-containing protein n=4 Tax=Rhizophagus irregularis TaxID=588596 RepID=A0A915Z3L6_9GLOM|nr:Hcm1p [Rhizophagus irregularis DAOM 197198w]UZO27278.1 hypothetical protein OCT59_019480 [Rhizophagus irregularis]GBC51476.2 forkhead box protein I2 [Rhizophagus irregularis DAOM 181602=DAOM 197198]CAB4483830.1 unnamed protein product [Rhizophagus irregularis]CAB5201909.1 unnamed protein product [Rhizophagus irregularis]